MTRRTAAGRLVQTLTEAGGTIRRRGRGLAIRFPLGMPAAEQRLVRMLFAYHRDELLRLLPPRLRRPRAHRDAEQRG